MIFFNIFLQTSICSLRPKTSLPTIGINWHATVGSIVKKQSIKILKKIYKNDCQKLKLQNGCQKPQVKTRD